jgi:hypothetical protein
MNSRPPEALLQVLIENGRAWVQSQRDRYWPEARRLTAAEKTELSPFFEASILDVARVAGVPRIENPPFYRELEAQGIPIPLDFTAMEAITFVDTILIAGGEGPGAALKLPLLFHELVHVVQYAALGKDAFVERYVRGWAEHGQDYYAIPLEQDAYDLQARYVALPNAGFSVEAAIKRRLGLG